MFTSFLTAIPAPSFTVIPAPFLNVIPAFSLTVIPAKAGAGGQRPETTCA
jgi:hypothetical protein